MQPVPRQHHAPIIIEQQVADPNAVEDVGTIRLPTDTVIATEKQLKDYLAALVTCKPDFGYAFSLSMQGVELGKPDGQICALSIKVDPREDIFWAGGYKRPPPGDPVLIVNDRTKLGNTNIQCRIQPYMTTELIHACRPRVIDVCKLKGLK